MEFFTRKINALTSALLIFLVIFSVSSTPFAHVVHADTGVPTPISYQGHLTDSGGNVLGGAGTAYYFKFSLWDSSTVGAGTKLWPTASPNSVPLTVKQGVFNVNIGDTTNGYPDTLNYNWNSNQKVYVQVEISSDNTNFETLGPRPSITSAPFAQVSNQTNGTGQSSFGTSTPFLNTLISALSTSINSAVMTIKGMAGQVANLFNVTDSNNNSLFTVAANGNVGVGTTTPANKLDVWGNMSVGTSSTPALFVNTATGFVGIGTATSDANLVVSGATGLRINSGTASNHLRLSVFGSDAYIDKNGGGNMYFRTSNSTALNLSLFGNGSVSIGNVTQGAKLEIFDNALAGYGSLAGSALNIAQTWNTTGTPTALKLNVTDTASNGNSVLMDLQVGGVSKFKVDKGGNVVASGYVNAGSFSAGNLQLSNTGINSNLGSGLSLTSSAGVTMSGTNNYQTSGIFAGVSAAFTFSPSTGTRTDIGMNVNPTINWGGTPGAGSYEGLRVNVIETSIPTGNKYLLRLGKGGSSFSSLFDVTSTGLVGIGTSTPTAQLHTTGTVRFQNFGAGSLSTDALGNLTVSSDERLKNIQGNFTRGLADLEKINPISYKWNTLSGYDTNSTYSGFSAQNMQLAIPEAVATSSNGFLTLSDRPIIATLVNAVKEIGAKIEKIMAWFGGDGSKFNVNGDVCVDDVCVTKDQFKAMLQNAGGVKNNPTIPNVISGAGNSNENSFVSTSTENTTTSTSNSTGESASSASTSTTTTTSTPNTPESLLPHPVSADVTSVTIPPPETPSLSTDVVKINTTEVSVPVVNIEAPAPSAQ